MSWIADALQAGQVYCSAAFAHAGTLGLSTSQAQPWAAASLAAQFAYGSAPTNLDEYAPAGRRLAPIDVAGETNRARVAFGETSVTELVSSGAATLHNITDVLGRGDFDILYLICHSAVTDKATILYLEK
jgi:hypothetical protein